MSTLRQGLAVIPTFLFFAGVTVNSYAAEATPAAAPSLQFSDLGGVKNWKAGGDAVIFVKNKADEWYKAEMAETCMTLDTKKGVNFQTALDPVTNEKTSAIVVDHHICRITSLTKVNGPPP